MAVSNLLKIRNPKLAEKLELLEAEEAQKKAELAELAALEEAAKPKAKAKK